MLYKLETQLYPNLQDFRYHSTLSEILWTPCLDISWHGFHVISDWYIHYDIFRLFLSKVWFMSIFLWFVLIPFNIWTKQFSFFQAPYNFYATSVPIVTAVQCPHTHTGVNQYGANYNFIVPSLISPPRLIRWYPDWLHSICSGSALKT